MTTAVLVILFFIGLAAIGVFTIWWGVLHASVDRDEDGEEVSLRVREISEATGPVPLEPRPHVRAGTPWGQV